MTGFYLIGLPLLLMMGIITIFVHRSFVVGDVVLSSLLCVILIGLMALDSFWLGGLQKILG